MDLKKVGAPIKPISFLLSAAIAFICGLVIGIVVTTLLEPILFFSLFVGIPAGFSTMLMVLFVLLLFFKRKEYQG